MTLGWIATHSTISDRATRDKEATVTRPEHAGKRFPVGCESRWGCYQSSTSNPPAR